jgi:chromosome segregation ATPase
MTGKTPLEYYERAIAELTKAREDIQWEREALKAEIQNIKQRLEQELENAKTEIEKLKAELHHTQRQLQESQQRWESQATQSKETANLLTAKIESVKTEIENGSIIAKKALMLQGRDIHHWMRFYKLDGVKHHCFQIWKGDNTWDSTIRVHAARKLV